MNTTKPTREMLRRWAPVMKRMAGMKPIQGFRVAAEFAMEDADFLGWWRSRVRLMPEPTRHRAVSFLRRLANRGPDWDFNKEFRQSFD